MADYFPTCAATNTPIDDGEKVRLVILARTPRSVRAYQGESVSIYSNDHWTPISLPIPGTFNSESLLVEPYRNNDWRLEVLFRGIQKYQKNKFLFKPDILTLQEMIHTGRIALNAAAAWTAETTLPSSSMLIREQAYQLLLEKTKSCQESAIDEFTNALKTHITLHHSHPSLWNNFDAMPGIAMKVLDETTLGPSRRGVPIRMRSMLADIIKNMTDPSELNDVKVRARIGYLIETYQFHRAFRSIGQAYAPRAYSTADKVDWLLLSEIQKQSKSHTAHAISMEQKCREEHS